MKKETGSDKSKSKDTADLDRRMFIKRVALDSTLAAGLVASGLALKGKGLPLEQIQL